MVFVVHPLRIDRLGDAAHARGGSADSAPSGGGGGGGGQSNRMHLYALSSISEPPINLNPALVNLNPALV